MPSSRSKTARADHLSIGSTVASINGWKAVKRNGSSLAVYKLGISWSSSNRLLSICTESSSSLCDEPKIVPKVLSRPATVVDGRVDAVPRKEIAKLFWQLHPATTTTPPPLLLTAFKQMSSSIITGIEADLSRSGERLFEGKAEALPQMIDLLNARLTDLINATPAKTHKADEADEGEESEVDEAEGDDESKVEVDE